MVQAAHAGPYVANEHGIFPGDERIDSDLDDSEDDLDEEDDDGEVEGDPDIVLCVYDKVRHKKV